MKIKTDLETLTRRAVDMETYIRFRERVRAGMAHPDWLGDLSAEDTRSLIADGGELFTFFDGETPVCSIMTILPDESELSDLGLGIPAIETVEYGPMFVDEKYRGNGLQYQMIRALDSSCKEKGYKYAIGAAHPDNVYSVNNFLRAGFASCGTRTLERGERMIFLKRL